MVGALDDVEVVLDDQHRVPRVHEALQNAQQPPHVVGVEAGGRLVEDIDGAARGALG